MLHTVFCANESSRDTFMSNPGEGLRYLSNLPQKATRTPSCICLMFG